MKSKVQGGERLALIQKAQKLYADFTGHDGEFFLTKVRLPKMPTAVVAIGECDQICYRTVRDGKRENYVHDFKKSARPLLCCSPDGTQLFLIGGHFEFTERGIVDK